MNVSLIEVVLILSPSSIKLRPVRRKKVLRQLPFHPLVLPIRKILSRLVLEERQWMGTGATVDIPLRVIQTIHLRGLHLSQHHRLMEVQEGQII